MTGLSAFLFFTLIITAWTRCADIPPCTCPPDSRTCMCRRCPIGYACNFDNGYCYPSDAPKFTPCKGPDDCKANEKCERGVCW